MHPKQWIILVNHWVIKNSPLVRESGIPGLTIPKIQRKDWNPIPGIQNPDQILQTTCTTVKYTKRFVLSILYYGPSMYKLKVFITRTLLHSCCLIQFTSLIAQLQMNVGPVYSTKKTKKKQRRSYTAMYICSSFLKLTSINMFLQKAHLSKLKEG